MAGNGNSGRPAKPAVLHLLNGNPGKRSAQELLDQVQNPAVPAEAPDKPGWLDEQAVQEWDQLIPDLLKLGLITRLDGQALAQYCEAVCEYRKFTQLIRQFNADNAHVQHAGDVQTYRTGAKNLSIWRTLRNDAQRRADELGRQFGFTPMSRRGLRPQSPQGELIPNEEREIANKYF